MRLAALVLVACVGAAPLDPVATRLAVRAETGVVSFDGATYAFDGAEVSIVRDGAVAAVAKAPGPWGAVATLVAPDKTRWVVGVAKGVLWRVSATGELEDVGTRLGLEGHRVLSVSATRSTFAIGLEKGVLVSRDSRHAMMFEGPPAPAVAASLDRVAIGREGAVEILDLARGSRTTYKLSGVLSVEFADRGTARARLVVSTRGGAFVERGAKLAALDGSSKTRALAVAGESIWTLGDTLGLYGTSGRPRRVTATITPKTRMHPASDGGVWLADGSSLVHVTTNRQEPEWTRTIEPVFQRVCARCHRPDGSADVDLSTGAAWSLRRDAIRRVIEQRAMPPDAPLDDGDRAAIERWLDR